MAVKTKKEKPADVEQVHQSKLFAVIETGGKQYLVKSGDIIRVEKMPKPGKGDVVSFDRVLLIGGEGEVNPHTKIFGVGVKLGDPYIKGAKVSGKWLKEGRNKKITHLRYHSKTRYQKKSGHRQIYTEIAIGEF